MLLFTLSAPPIRCAVITKVEQLIIHTHLFTLLQFILYARPLRYRYVYEHITITNQISLVFHTTALTTATAALQSLLVGDIYFVYDGQIISIYV